MRFPTSQLPKSRLNMVCFVFQMCFAPQPRALCVHFFEIPASNSAPRMVSFDTFYIFLLPNVLRTTTVWKGTSIGGVLATQFILEAEVLPFAVALRIWGTALRDCCVFVFIDDENEAAKAAWITAFALSEVARHVLHQGKFMEAELNV